MYIRIKEPCIYSFASLLGHVTESVLLVSHEPEEVLVIFPEGLSVRDGDEGDALILHVLVEVALDVDAHSACAFVQDSVDGLVVNQASHGDALLLTAGEDIVPVSNGVPGAFSAHEVVEADFIQDDL